MINIFGLGGLKKVTVKPAELFNFKNRHLQALVDALKRVKRLSLSELLLTKLDITDLSPLKELSHVRKFTLGVCFEIENLEFLKDWAHLEFLQLSGLPLLSSFVPLANKKTCGT
jgi:hypothetical protein